MDMWWEWGEKPNVLPHPPTAEPCVAVAIIQILKWSPSGEVNYIYTTHTHTHTVSTPIRAQILTRADMPGQIYDKHTHTHTHTRNTCTNTNMCGHARANI